MSSNGIGISLLAFGKRKEDLSGIGKMKSFFTFTPQGEKLSITDLAALFAEPPCYEEFVQPTNHFLIGAKGSGKSSLLRAVSVPVAAERGSLETMPFLGFYIPFKSTEGDIFKENYKYTMSTELFGLYFSLKVLFNILQSLGQVEQLKGVRDDFIKDVLQTYVTFPEKSSSSDSTIMLINQSQSFLAQLGHNPALLKSELLHLIPSITSVPSVGAVLSHFSEYLEHKGFQTPCFLIDGYDFFHDEMRLSMLALARKEFPFCVKIAGRFIYDRPEHVNSTSCEWNRDIRVLSLDHEGSTNTYGKLCIEAANRILRKQEVSNTCEEIFGIQNVPNDAHCFCGIDVLVRLSSGNLKRFLDLCGLASRTKEAAFNFDDRPIVSFQKQHIAVKNFALNLFLDELPTDIRTSFKELRCFVFWVLKEMSQLPKIKQTLNFMLTGNIKESTASVLRRGFIYRYLICSNADFIRLNLTPGYLPLRFSVNSAFAPKFDFLPSSNEFHELEAIEVERYMQKATRWDPEYEEKGYRKPSLGHGQGDFFQDISCEINPIFISHPLSLQGIEEDLKNKRVTLLKRTIDSLTKDESPSLAKLGQIKKEEEYSIAARDLPSESAPDFRNKVEQRIMEARYTIHDITKPSMGVFFELGLAAAFETPYFLFCHLDHLSKDIKEKVILPKELSGLDVKKYSKGTNGSFKKWFEQTVHNLAKSLPHKITCRFHSFTASCSRTKIIEEKPKQLLYLAISPSNSEIREIIAGLATSEYDMVLAQDWPAMTRLDAHCCICAPLQACSCAIGLCDSGDYIGAVSLGMLQGLKKNFVLINNRAQTKMTTIAMSREKIIDYSPSTLKRDIEKGVRNFLGGIKEQK